MSFSNGLLFERRFWFCLFPSRLNYLTVFSTVISVGNYEYTSSCLNSAILVQILTHCKNWILLSVLSSSNQSFVAAGNCVGNILRIFMFCVPLQCVSFVDWSPMGQGLRRVFDISFAGLSHRSSTSIHSHHTYLPSSYNTIKKQGL